TSSPVSSASACSDHFHSRPRLLWLPPESARISRPGARGGGRPPGCPWTPGRPAWGGSPTPPQKKARTAPPPPPYTPGKAPPPRRVAAGGARRARAPRALRPTLSPPPLPSAPPPPGGAEAPACADGRLLERFARRGEEAAFEALLRRHGPMVLGVCRRLLR